MQNVNKSLKLKLDTMRTSHAQEKNRLALMESQVFHVLTRRVCPFVHPSVTRAKEKPISLMQSKVFHVLTGSKGDLLGFTVRRIYL